MAFLVVGFIIFAISGSTPKAAPVAPVPQVVAQGAVPVAPTHAVKKHKQEHVAHRAPATAAKQDVVPASDSSQPMR
jgi:hypothetical protein